MNHPTDRIAHTTVFVTPVVEHWLEREIAKWVLPIKDRSDDPSHHERTLLPRSYISLPIKSEHDLSLNSPLFAEAMNALLNPILPCCTKSFLQIKSTDENVAAKRFKCNKMMSNLWDSRYQITIRFLIYSVVLQMELVKAIWL